MPDWKNEIRKRLLSARLSPARENEIVEELAQHLDDVYEQALRNGASEHEAHRMARNELDQSNLLAQELRSSHRPVRQEPVPVGGPSKGNMFIDIIQDVRYGARILFKNPSFTFIAVLALALGIGANTAIFTVVNAVLLRPLPYNDPARLMTVWEDASKIGFPHNTPSPANFIDWRDQNQLFEGMAALHRQTFNLTGDGEPERIDGRRVSTNLFALLGVDPQLGRVFLAEEDQPGSNRVVILSNRLWHRRFAADKLIVGKTLSLNGEPYTVVGVMPQRFEFPTREDELWVPIAFDSEEAGRRGSHYLEVIGRTRPGVELEQAQAEMNSIGARLQQQYPNTNSNIGVTVIPLHEDLVGDIKPALLMLLGAVGFVLLVACANVANLLLARAAVRQKEIAVRMALGASRWRLVRQFLTESVLLGALGGIFGLGLSFVALIVLKSFIPENISQASTIAIDARVLGFTLLVSILTGLIFGLAPAAQRSDLNDVLKDGGREGVAGSRGNRMRGLLVIGEVAVSLLLLIGAGLLINSFMRLRNLDPGFQSDHVLTMGIVLPQSKYPDRSKRAIFYSEVLRRVESLPGVKSAGVVNWIPLVFQGDSIGISIEGQPDPVLSQRPNAATRVINPNYFSSMGMRLLKGRNVDDRDKSTSPAVAVISESMAKRFWPNQDPIGKRFTPGDPTRADQWIQVIGVVNDIRQFELTAEPKPQMYLTYEQIGFFAPRYLVVKTDVEPTSLASAVRNAVWEVDKDQPVSNIATMEEVLSDSIARQRFSMLLLAIFAGVALVLAAVGIYGVMSYSVAQRTHEIGIRMALGAQTGAVLKLAVGYGLKLVLVGVVIGLIAAFLLTRVMSTLLFGITPTDPMTFTLISAILILVALIASYIPARRATKVDPVIALRYQ
jgi:putative ABC transport system permease protein